MKRSLLLLVAGCVWAEAPPDAVLADMCSHCAEDEACDRGECTEYCSEESFLYQPCVDPARVCDYGDCVVPCVESECPGGFTCSDLFLGECEDFCLDDSDCREGFRCCGSSSDGCDFAECFRR